MGTFMEERYNHAIKAGVIGGVLFIILSILEFVSVFIHLWALQLALVCLFLLLLIVIAAGTGALAVRYARPVLHNLTDAVVVSGVAGLIAGIIYAVMRVVTSFISAIVVHEEVYDISRFYGIPASYGGYAQSWIGSCCCAPFVVIIIIILAVIGGALYAALIAKLP